MVKPDGALSVVQFTDSYTFGGAEQVLLDLIAGLDRRFWRPILLHHNEPGLQSLLMNAHRMGVTTRPVPRIESIRDIGCMPQLVRVLRAERPAIFHAHLSWPLSCKYGLTAAILARVPIIVATAHLYVKPPKKLSVHAHLRLNAAFVDRYLAVSHGVARQLAQSLRIPPRKIRVIRNGISIPASTRPATAALRSTITKATDRPIVLVSARLEKQKGHQYLIEATAHVPEAVFIFAGVGSEQTRLEAQAKALGVTDRITFLGHREDIADLLASCDLFVLPSLFEGLPLSILEAMAACKPVVATAVDGNKEIVIDGQTGLLVPPADPVALAGAIRTVLSDPVLARRLAAGGKARVQEEFCAERMVKSVMQVYEELVN
jgi:glycosyltransferase involved in cell wall biosynthesis